MTRAELYELVWQHPITHLAPRFDLSDVGVRKLCLRYGIPVPQRGYWTKRKSNRAQTPRRRRLPPLRLGVSEQINITDRGPNDLPEVPKHKPTKRQDLPTFALSEPRGPLHQTVRRAQQSMVRGADDKATSVGPAAVAIAVSAPSVDRALLLADTFLRFVESRGHEVITDITGIQLLVHDEEFSFSIQEATRPFVRKPADKKLQAERERALKRGEKWIPPHERPLKSRWQTLRDDGRRWYNEIGREPSGRLVLEISGLDKWRDIFSRRVEEYVATAVVTMETEALERPVRRQQDVERRLLREQHRAEEMRREEQDAAKRGREQKHLKFLTESAGAHRRIEELARYLAALEALEEPAVQSRVNRLIRRLRLQVQASALTPDALERTLSDLDLFGEGDC